MEMIIDSLPPRLLLLLLCSTLNDYKLYFPKLFSLYCYTWFAQSIQHFIQAKGLKSDLNTAQNSHTEKESEREKDGYINAIYKLHALKFDKLE